MKKIWMTAACLALLMGCNNIPGDTNVPSGAIETIPISNKEVTMPTYVKIYLSALELQNARREGDNLVFGLIYRDMEGKSVSFDKKVSYTISIRTFVEGGHMQGWICREETGDIANSDAEISLFLPLSTAPYVQDIKGQEPSLIGKKYFSGSSTFPKYPEMGLMLESAEENFQVIKQMGAAGTALALIPLDPALLGIGDAE